MRVGGQLTQRDAGLPKSRAGIIAGLGRAIRIQGAETHIVLARQKRERREKT
ncbi:MAG: hypothetical protein M3A44_08795 [Gammaproteobacteria bacterium]